MKIPSDISLAPTVRLSAGDPVFSHGQPCANYLVVREGTVRVFSRSAAGREVMLYRVRPGEMCVLTTACLLGHTDYPAEAVAETDVTAHALPSTDFERILETSGAFRRYLFYSFSQRIADVMRQLAQIALEGTERRVAVYLLANAGVDDRLYATHEAIGLEIGASREVVSRHLKELERAGMVTLGRGRIEVLQRDRLAQLT